MSDQLMDTEPGGESTQYESIQTVTKPASKQGGQMGNTSDRTQAPTSGSQQETSENKAARNDKTAENQRYGQKLSEEGMGGQTTTSGGSANAGGGYGGTEDTTGNPGTTADKTRKAEGYGEDEDMDKTIGG